jgi:signal transduction histidine kinase
MQAVDPKLVRTTIWIAGVVAAAVAIIMPVGYFAISYQNLIGELTTEAEINGHIASEVINANPEMWRFQQYKLDEFLSRRLRRGEAEARRILDKENDLIAESVDALESPVITESSELQDSGVVVGRMEVSRSLRPLLLRTGLVGLLGLLLSMAIFATLKVLPLRALGHALADNVQLYEEASRNLNRIRALHEIDLAITSTLDLHGILHVLLEKIDLVLPYAATTVRLFNPENGLLEPAACRNLDEKEWKTEAWRGGRGLANVAFETNAPTIIRNAQTDPRVRDPEFYRKHKLISYLAIPLIAKEKTLGVIGFYTRQEHDFSNDEVEFLKTLTGQAAIAIHNAQIYGEVSLSRKELELKNQYLDKSLRQLGGLYTALTPIDAAASMPELMGGIIERLMGATGADAALIRVWNKEDGTLPIVGHRGFSDQYLKRVENAPPRGAVEWVIKHSDPIITPDIASEPRLKGKVQLQMGLRSCAILPLNVHGEVRGILHVASCKLGYFNEEQKDHLTAIVRQMSIAMDNHELFYSLKSSRDELEKANKIKDEFLSVMSHELRTPLNVMMGYTGLLREGMFGALNPQQDDALKKVVIQSNDLLSIVSNLLRATQIGNGEIKAERARTDLGQLLDEIKNGYDLPATNELTLNWDFPSDLLIVETDSEKLRHILVNLINNAIKFTEKGSVTITARHLPKSKTLRVTVADTGPGIARESLPIIFDMFRQLDGSNTRAHGGLGLGLYIVKKYTELLGGKVEVKSDLGKGSNFTVTIPCEAAAQRPSWQYDQFEQAL